MLRLQRLRFHTTSYITKHFAQCQGEVRRKGEIIFDLFQIHPAQTHQTGRSQAIFGLQIGLGAAETLPDDVQHEGSRLRVDTKNAEVEVCLLYTSDAADEL